MFQNTITLFNYHKATGLWYHTVFNKVDLGVNKASNYAKDGHNNNDAVTLLINCTKDKKFIAADGTEKSYTGAKEYARCNDPTDHITFAPGSDFIYEGVWPDSEFANEGDYESGFYHAMNDTYDGVYMITSAQFYDLIPHFEIGGR